uniref:MI domain-containing protein n=1 Tax=Daucus carota subsp. sativus TaxID=79200 RepID=A0A166BSY9_DAUCS
MGRRHYRSSDSSSDDDEYKKNKRGREDDERVGRKRSDDVDKEDEDRKHEDDDKKNGRRSSSTRRSDDIRDRSGRRSRHSDVDDDLEEGQIRKTSKSDDNGEKRTSRKEDRRDDNSKQETTNVLPPPPPLDSRTGGVYIPPFKLARMLNQVEDKSSVEYQRLTWDALRKSINGLVNKVNATNIKNIIPELFAENLIRGRGLFCRSCIKSQMASPGFTDVFAALVAVVNTKFPQVGDLLLRRIILQLQRAYKRNDKPQLLAAVKFIAHLVNQQIVHELVALELLTTLLENPTDDSVEVAVGFVTQCGSILQDLCPRGLHGIFERFRGILHEGEIDKRVQFLIEGLFAIRKAKFQGYPAIRPELDLVEQEDQLTHEISLLDQIDPEIALEAGHKLLKIKLEPGQEMELCIMLLECCSQERTYLRYYGLLGQRFCLINKIHQENFEKCFVEQYSMIHRLETNKLRNVAKFFAHLLGTDALPWQALAYIRLTEDATTSSSRIFIKILFQELSEHLGIRLLNERLSDPTMQDTFESIFPRDNPKNTRFSINFFTSIGLGGITENLREYLKNMPRLIMQQQKPVSESEDDSDTSSADSDASSSESESGSSSESESESDDRQKKKRRRR